MSTVTKVTPGSVMSNEEKLRKFVQVCLEASQNGHSNTWISNKTGLTLKAVQQLRTRLRHEGVPLPTLARGPEQQPLNLDSLNKIIADTTGESLKVVRAKSQELVKSNEDRLTALAK